MTESGQTTTAKPAATRRRGGLAMLALVPFAVIVLFFLVLPALSLLWGSFHVGGSGATTLANYDYLRGEDKSLQPFINSFVISFASMVTGGILGLIIAQALVSSKNRVLEQLTITFSSVAANFAGSRWPSRTLRRSVSMDSSPGSCSGSESTSTGRASASTPWLG